MDIGRKSPLPFGVGTILAVFQEEGKLEVVNEELITKVIGRRSIGHLNELKKWLCTHQSQKYMKN